MVTAGTITSVKFAYADPPYPGQAKRWYGNHPDYAGEVDHAELIGRLCRDYPDGWALSTSSAAMRDVLDLCPSDVQVAIWYVTNRNLRGNGRWELVWEPVIVRAGRQAYGSAPTVRNLLPLASLQGIGGNTITGQKPPTFCRWVFGLLGALPGDEVDDLFPGSGVVAAEWKSYCAQGWLPTVREPNDGSGKQARVRQARRLDRSGSATLLDDCAPPV